MMNGIGSTGAGGASTNGGLRALQDSMKQMASGKKLNSAADNAAGIALAVEMVSELGGLRQASRNVGDAMGMLQTADGGASGISDALTRMTELSVQAGNGTLSPSQRSMIQEELNTLTNSIDRIAGTTEFNGQGLLDGSTESLTFQVGAGADAPNQITVALEALDTGSLGVGSLSSGTVGDAGLALDAIGAALDQVSGFRASLGSSINQLEETQSNLQNQIVAQSGSLSNLQDTDFGTASSDVASQSVLLQARIAMQAQGNLSQGAVLKLLG